MRRNLILEWYRCAVTLSSLLSSSPSPLSSACPLLFLLPRPRLFLVSCLLPFPLPYWLPFSHPCPLPFPSPVPFALYSAVHCPFPFPVPFPFSSPVLFRFPSLFYLPVPYPSFLFVLSCHLPLLSVLLFSLPPLVLFPLCLNCSSSSFDYTLAPRRWPTTKQLLLWSPHNR